MITSNKQLIQSYILSSSRYDFTLIEKRVLYRLVEISQSLLEGKKLDKTFTISENLWNDKMISLSLKSIVGQDYTNLEVVKKSLRNLREKSIVFEDDNDWEVCGIIDSVKFKKQTSVCEFRVNIKVWELIVNFSRGFRKMELKTLFQLNSVYSCRLYELLSNQKVITYTIENLKEMFGVSDKYKLNSDFIRIVIERSKKELDEKSVWSFNYKVNKSGRRFHSITFFGYEVEKNIDVELRKKQLSKDISVRWYLNTKERDSLVRNIGFNDMEIKRNMVLLQEFKEKGGDLLMLISRKKRDLREMEEDRPRFNKKGYFINVLKSELKSIKEKISNPDIIK